MLLYYKVPSIVLQKLFTLLCLRKILFISKTTLTSSGSVILNSQPSPVHEMKLWLFLCDNNSNRNCHNWIGPPVGGTPPLFVISECPPTDWTDAKEDELVELETIAAREWVKGIVVDETEVAGCKSRTKNTIEKFVSRCVSSNDLNATDWKLK